jgi:Raf kinase inhibitor-like YbhB/YbcL family protein
MMRLTLKKTIVGLVLMLTSCAFAADKPFSLLSTAFRAGGAIPVMYTCQGVDVSPPLLWMDPPAGTQSYALLLTDADSIATVGRSVVHAVIYNINAVSTGMPTNFQGHFFGLNSFNNAKYQGPCPPQGMHHYVFSLYALNEARLEVESVPTIRQLTNAMQGHILDVADMTVTFAREE